MENQISFLIIYKYSFGQNDFAPGRTLQALGLVLNLRTSMLVTLGCDGDTVELLCRVCVECCYLLGY